MDDITDTNFNDKLKKFYEEIDSMIVNNIYNKSQKIFVKLLKIY